MLINEDNRDDSESYLFAKRIFGCGENYNIPVFLYEDIKDFVYQTNNVLSMETIDSRAGESEVIDKRNSMDDVHNRRFAMAVLSKFLHIVTFPIFDIENYAAKSGLSDIVDSEEFQQVKKNNSFVTINYRFLDDMIDSIHKLTYVKNTVFALPILKCISKYFTKNKISDAESWLKYEEERLRKYREEEFEKDLSGLF